MIQDLPRDSICIVYWGKRGGGRLLTEQIFQAANESSIRTLLFLRPNSFRSTGDQIGILNICRWIMERRRLLHACSRENVKVAIFPMASPWDIFLRRSLNRRGVDIRRIIHDASRHSGDYFPTNFWIKWLVNDSNKIVTLSNFVHDDLVSRYGIEPRKIVVSALPSPMISKRLVRKSPIENLTFLFIGRGRTYKGLNLLLDTWEMIADQKSRLLIAGEGHKVRQGLPGVEHIDRWLEDSEIIELISNATAVILPYLEASQSGLIPFAQRLGIPVIVTPVGGLREQVIDGVTGIITQDLSRESLAQAMNLVKTLDFNPLSNEPIDSSLRLLNDCLG